MFWLKSFHHDISQPVAYAFFVEASQLVETIGHLLDVHRVFTVWQASDEVAMQVAEHDETIVFTGPLGQNGALAVIGNEFVVALFGSLLALHFFAFIAISVHGSNGIIMRRIIGNGETTNFLAAKHQVFGL